MFTRKTLFVFATALSLALIAAVSAPRVSFSVDEPTGTTSAVTCPNFVDLNGDGYNDNAPDQDGDGIPNCKDADYTRPLNGKGPQNCARLGNAAKNGNAAGQGTCLGQQNRMGAGKGNKRGTGAGTCTGTGGGATGTAKRSGGR